MAKKQSKYQEMSAEQLQEELTKVQAEVASHKTKIGSESRDYKGYRNARKNVARIKTELSRLKNQNLTAQNAS